MKMNKINMQYAINNWQRAISKGQLAKEKRKFAYCLLLIAYCFSTNAQTLTLDSVLNRIERNHLSERPFMLIGPNTLANKNVLIVDDVITTGATMEAAASYLWSASNPKSISIVAAAYTI